MDRVLFFPVQFHPKTLYDDQCMEEDPANLQVLRKEVEQNIPSNGWEVVDKVPPELFKCGEKETVQVFTVLCRKIWDTNNSRPRMEKVTGHTLSKKGNRKCYRTICLIMTVMLKVIQNRKTRNAGFKAGRKTVLQQTHPDRKTFSTW